MTLEPTVRTRLDELVNANRVVLFMKGVRGAPQCGFSAAVVDTLDRHLREYVTLDVLRDQVLRESIKLYSEWPTIPQLYVNGEFVGGCDIVREMDASGELAQLLVGEAAGRAAVAEPLDSPPTISLTPAAAEAIAEALGDDAAELCLRVTVDAGFYTELSLEPAAAGDVTVAVDKLRIVLDPASARRADGVKIDFVVRDGETGFRVDNPNAPKLEAGSSGEVRNITVEQLKADLDAGSDFQFVDVRSDGERRIACVPGSRLLDPEEGERLAALPKTTRMVFMCHHGGRSMRAAQQFLSLGFSNVDNVVGGIDAWSQRIDRNVARY